MMRPCLPRSLPPLRICHEIPLLDLDLRCHCVSEHLGSQADDLHEVLLAQLTGDGPEDARPRGLRWLSMALAAFSSNAICVPSSRP